MALITCPHCGKSVSDSVESCIHCGGSLREKPAIEREYAALPAEEQKKLRVEFEQKYPEVAQSDKENERLGRKLMTSMRVMAVVVAITIILAAVFVFIVIFTSYDLLIGMIIDSVFLFVLIVGLIIVALYYGGKLTERRMKGTKRFQTWLKREKNVHYSVILNEKERRKYEQIMLD